MQGFVNFADDVGQAISVVIPAICYLLGISFLIAAGWGCMQLSKGGNGSWVSRPWMPLVTLLIGSALLTFDRMLNLGEATLGSTQTASISDGLTSYTPPAIDSSGLMGNSPEQTIVNIIDAFDYFFINYGAWIILTGILALKHVSEGRRNHGPSLPVVQIIFGFGVMNINTIAPYVMSYFT
jgi:hypothetical protein